MTQLPELNATSRLYLDDVKARMWPLPADFRSEILTDLHVHLAAEHQSTDDESLRRQVGEPAVVASRAFEDYRDQTGRDLTPRYWSRSRALAVAALAATVLAAAALLVLPVYTSVVSVSGSSEPGMLEAGGTSLADVNGALVAILLVPIGLAVAPVAAPPRSLRAVLIACAPLLSAFVVLGMASVGMFFAPAALLLVVSLVLRVVDRR